MKGIHDVPMLPPPPHLQPVIEVDESSTLQVQLVHDADVGRCVGHAPVLRPQLVVLKRATNIINTAFSVHVSFKNMLGLFCTGLYGFVYFVKHLVMDLKGTFEMRFSNKIYCGLFVDGDGESIGVGVDFSDVRMT